MFICSRDDFKDGSMLKLPTLTTRVGVLSNQENGHLKHILCLPNVAMLSGNLNVTENTAFNHD